MGTHKIGGEPHGTETRRWCQMSLVGKPEAWQGFRGSCASRSPTGLMLPWTDRRCFRMIMWLKVASG